MRLARAGYSFIVAACASLLLTAACGSSSGTKNRSDGSQAGSGPTLGGIGGSTSASGNGGVTDPTDECAGELVEARNLPLDMYVMLDVSGSMLEPTGSDVSVTKWQAVSSALLDFVGDEASAGLGMGLQVFPLAHPEAPASCTTDAECGKLGPCANRGCWPLVDGVLNGCLTGATCLLSQDCVVIGECANDRALVCNHDSTTSCGAEAGACVVPPSQCLLAADCRPEAYAAPAAAIAELPGAAPAITAVIAAATPDPGALTPTGPALAGALRHAGAWALAHPERQVVAVLATDGLPTLQDGGEVCKEISRQAEINAVAALARTGLTGNPPITTFVIGVVGAEVAGAAETLTNIAKAGGSSQAFIVDPLGNVTSQFRDALNAIRETRLACELEVPAAQAGKPIDYLEVNVQLDDGSGPAQLVYVTDANGCEGATSGWYYDVVDPRRQAPQRIIACPDTCAAFGRVRTGSVQIKLGCATRTPVK
jgi:hypothetical protein